MHPTIVFMQAYTSVMLRQFADRLDIDTSDEGFTTVEKVVLTGIAVLIAIAAGAAVKDKVSTLVSQISTSFG